MLLDINHLKSSGALNYYSYFNVVQAGSDVYSCFSKDGIEGVPQIVHSQNTVDHVNERIPEGKELVSTQFIYNMRIYTGWFKINLIIILLMLSSK